MTICCEYSFYVNRVYSCEYDGCDFFPFLVWIWNVFEDLRISCHSFLRLIDSHHLQPFQFSFYCYGHFGRRNLHTILAFNAFDNYAEFFAFCLEMGWILTFPSKLLIISTPFWPALFSLQKQHDGKNWEKLHLISYVEILNQMPN